MEKMRRENLRIVHFYVRTYEYARTRKHTHTHAHTPPPSYTNTHTYTRSAYTERRGEQSGAGRKTHKSDRY